MCQCLTGTSGTRGRYGSAQPLSWVPWCCMVGKAGNSEQILTSQSSGSSIGVVSGLVREPRAQGQRLGLLPLWVSEQGLGYACIRPAEVLY